MGGRQPHINFPNSPFPHVTVHAQPRRLLPHFLFFSDAKRLHRFERPAAETTVAAPVSPLVSPSHTSNAHARSRSQAKRQRARAPQDLRRLRTEQFPLSLFRSNGVCLNKGGKGGPKTSDDTSSSSYTACDSNKLALVQLRPLTQRPTMVCNMS